jgi:hypothetical protein
MENQLNSFLNKTDKYIDQNISIQIIIVIIIIGIIYYIWSNKISEPFGNSESVKRKSFDIDGQIVNYINKLWPISKSMILMISLNDKLHIDPDHIHKMTKLILLAYTYMEGLKVENNTMNQYMKLKETYIQMTKLYETVLDDIRNKYNISDDDVIYYAEKIMTINGQLKTFLHDNIDNLPDEDIIEIGSFLNILHDLLSDKNLSFIYKPLWAFINIKSSKYISSCKSD